MQELRAELLGPIRAFGGDHEIMLGSPKQRAVFGILAAARSRAVSRTEITEGLWGEDCPANAAAVVYTYIARLRRALEPGHVRARRDPAFLLASSAAGYMLRLSQEAVDLQVFEQYLLRARQQWRVGNLAAAIGSFGEALGLWRGPPFSGAFGPFADGQRTRLSELRLAALEDRAEIMLAAGRHTDVVTELLDLTRAHPLRERAHGLLMIALYQGGRQAEALAAFGRVRRLLVDELGIEPNPDLQRIQQLILVGETEITTASLTGRVTADLDEGRTTRSDTATGFGSHGTPRQLPGEAPGFTGRQAELARLDDLLSPAAESAGNSTRIAVLSGTAGVGKTSLAVHWAHQVAGRFPDGQMYVNLRGYDAHQEPMPPGEALSCLLRGLDVGPQGIPGSLDEQTAILRTLLADKRILLVLDNAASPQQVRPLLPGTPSAVALITSRNDLGGLVAREGARRLVLTVLSSEESLALLARIAGATRLEAEPQAAAELARLCGGLPLALRIAAEQVAGHPLPDAFAELVAELCAENRLDQLSADADDDAAVRPVLSWSYRVLPAQPARLFRLLGLHPGPEFSASVAAALAGSTTAAVRPLLGILVRRNLLDHVARDRFRLHELLHLYAAELAAAEEADHEREAAVGRMLVWYLHTADSAASALATAHQPLPPSTMIDTFPSPRFASHQDALSWLETERVNLTAATRQAAQTSQPSLAWLLASVLWEFFNLRKHWTDWATTSHIGLAAARLLGDREGEGRMLGSLGILQWDLGHFEEAEGHFEASIKIWRECGNRSAEARCLIGMGNAYQGLRRYEEALTYHERAVTACREAGDRWAQGLALTCLSTVYQDLRRYGDAIATYLDSLAIYRELGDRWGEGSTLSFLGEVYGKMGRSDEAISQLRQALSIRRDIGDRHGAARSLRKLGDVLRGLGRYREAADYYQQALSISTEIGDQRMKRRAQGSLEEIAHATSR